MNKKYRYKKSTITLIHKFGFGVIQFKPNNFGAEFGFQKFQFGFELGM